MGDTFWNGVYPFIDYSTGGSIDGSIRAAERDLAVTTDKTIIIPGHGRPVSNRAELQAFRDMLVGARANVDALKRKGFLEAIVAAKPTAAFDATWGTYVSARRSSQRRSTRACERHAGIEAGLIILPRGHIEMSDSFASIALTAPVKAAQPGSAAARANHAFRQGDFEITVLSDGFITIPSDIS